MKGTELTIPVITKGRLTDVKDFEELIVIALRTDPCAFEGRGPH
jgi:hypothetical protein